MKQSIQKKLLVIGASTLQVPLIQKAKSAGVYVIVASRDGDYPGFRLADRSYKVDILDGDSILKIAQDECISGVVTDQMDLGVPVAAYIAEKLSLPGIGHVCADVFTNKAAMRSLARRVGVPCPESASANSLEEALSHAEKIGYPVIVKPSDSSGSKGVAKVVTPVTLNEAFSSALRYSLSGVVVIEKFLSGSEYLSHGYVEDGRLRILAHSNRYYFGIQDKFLPNITIFPSDLPRRVIDRMEMYYHRLMDAMKPRFGSSFAEWIYCEEEDQLFLTEVSIRGGGVFITSDLVPYACGIDQDQYLIKDVLALSSPEGSIFDQPLIHRAAAYLFFLLPEGTVCQVSGLTEISGVKGVYRSDVRRIVPGMVILPLEHKGSREGPILIVGETREDIFTTINEIRTLVKIEVMTPNGVAGAIWE